MLKKFNLDGVYQGQTKVDGEHFMVEDAEGGHGAFRACLDVGLARTSTGARVFGAMKVRNCSTNESSAYMLTLNREPLTVVSTYHTLRSASLDMTTKKRNSAPRCTARTSLDNM